MNKIQELRNKRHDVWNKAKAFLEEKRDKDGFVSAEDTETYERMEQDVVNFGKEIERLERQRDMDMKLVEATSRPEVSNPMSGQEEKLVLQVTSTKETSGMLCAPKHQTF